MASIPDGFRYLPGYLDRPAQEALVDDIRKVVEAAPLYTPAMPRTGKEMSVRMTNCGALGWVTDKERGYRYQPTHPQTGEPWPPIPRGATVDLERSLGMRAAAAGLPRQLLFRHGEDGAAPGQRRTGSRRAGGVGVARRHVPVPDRPDGARGSDLVVQADQRRRGGAWWRSAALFPRRRPHPFRNIDASEEWWADQPDAAPGYSFLSATSSTRWSLPLRRMRSARGRVGRMFSRRFFRLMLFQSPSAIARAVSSDSAE